MPSFVSKTLISALAGAASVAAHGHVKNFVINGLSYQAYDPTVFPYMQNPPIVAGWTSANTDNGFVGPEDYSNPDIICHKSATNAKGHAVIKAGDSVYIQWDTWPESHHGPVIDYLASCGSAGCETVDKAQLEFFKIAEAGLIDGSQAPGKWAADQLIAQNNSWLVTIPENIKPGFYVLRHEIIALHSAGQTNGAQNYPVCINLEVTGGGSDLPSGVKGTELYKPTDPGILINIYQPLSSYTIPGPALMPGAKPVTQRTSAIIGSTTAITGTATAAPAAPTSTAAATTTTSANANPIPTTTLRTSTIAPQPTAAPTQTPTSRVGQPPRPTRCPGLDNLKRARRHARDLAAH
ncbi:uncharacterized protein CTHT_0040570 [Thermochaetoides thermophila DSM 1495]|uniref:lytic cellulose monooxygenase (C4-dehydrogenating) n=2 Tax=Thermochaetoides thermophila TaxID=209285 RepID=G0SA07_CHATD|nr:hypothetical protein CTHT_0040570 [Thermochaetoides thermophila DSM 1495]EGS19579.1 hypothetical protein CTHT_0040570 [Thermochaetoides thermophila DSM 1495]